MYSVGKKKPDGKFPILKDGEEVGTSRKRSDAEAQVRLRNYKWGIKRRR